MTEKILMTQEGYDALRLELDRLRTEKRDEISEKIRVARGFGDLSENSEYDEAKNEQAVVEARISQLSDQLQKVELLDESEISRDVASIGSTVTILDLEYDEKMTYQIVTSVEANHSTVETISDESPVGKAILGHKAGDQVDVVLPNGSKARFKIVEITL